MIVSMCDSHVSWDFFIFAGLPVIFRRVVSHSRLSHPLLSLRQLPNEFLACAPTAAFPRTRSSIHTFVTSAMSQILSADPKSETDCNGGPTFRPSPTAAPANERPVLNHMRLAPCMQAWGGKDSMKFHDRMLVSDIEGLTFGGVLISTSAPFDSVPYPRQTSSALQLKVRSSAFTRNLTWMWCESVFAPLYPQV